MNKKFLLAGVVLFFVGMVFVKFNVIPDKIEEEFLGGINIPDRCEWYDQSASRSIKDTVKTASGKVFYFRVTNSGQAERFFSVYDLARRASNSDNPIYAAPIGGTTASRSPAALIEDLPAPLSFNTGITWAVSTQFGNFASSGIDRDNLTVSICYY